MAKKLYDWFGLTFAFSWRGAVLAAAVMSFPLMVRAIRLALEGVDMKLEQAARTLGAGRWRVFFHHHASPDVTGHYCRDGTGLRPLAGRVWRDHHLRLEHPRRDANHPSAMYTLIQTPGGEGAAARLCIISIVLALASLMVSEWLARLSRQRMGK